MSRFVDSAASLLSAGTLAPRKKSISPELLRAALVSWKGDPADMTIHAHDELEGAPVPPSASGAAKRAQAAALLGEIKLNGRPTPALYRGDNNDPLAMNRRLVGWTTNRSVAEAFAKKYAGSVHSLPAGSAIGIPAEGMGEDEWIVDHDTIKKTVRPNRDPEFDAWFKGSKVTDENGEPLIVKHGTTHDFDQFEKSDSAHTKVLGFDTYFFTNNDAVASTYAPGKKGKLIPVALRLKNPLVIEGRGREWHEALVDVQDQLSTYRTPEEKEYMDFRRDVSDRYAYEIDSGEGLPADVQAELSRRSKQQDQHILANRELYANAKRTPHHYDGLIIKDTLDATANPVNHRLHEGSYSPFSTQYVAFSPDQIRRLDRSSAKVSKPVMKSAAHISTPAFKNWFGDWENEPHAASKVVDKDGRPLVAYKAMYPHDWSKEDKKTGDPGPLIESIDRPGEFPSFNGSEPGVKIAGFFGSKEIANKFATNPLSGMSSIYPVYLNLRSPHVIDAKGKKAGAVQFGPEGKPFRDAIRSGKFDGVIIKNTEDEGDLYVALKPEQIKSATANEGTYDPSDKRLRKSFGSLRTKPHASWQDVAEEPEYAYHATSIENLHGIAGGRLNVNRPDYGTDQDTWPDGATEKRAYFTHSPRVAYSFAPEHGVPALLRVPRSVADFRKESTGDLYVKKPIDAKHFEVALEDGSWAPIVPKTEPPRKKSGGFDLKAMVESVQPHGRGYKPPKEIKADDLPDVAPRMSGDEMAEWVKKNAARWNGGGSFESDTANELHFPLRRNPLTEDLAAFIGSKSSMPSALRAIDSHKNWGTGWAAAADEWEAASKLGGSGKMSKTSADALSGAGASLYSAKRVPLSDEDIKAFRARQAYTHAALRDEHPTGEITVYRGISGAQAKKLAKAGVKQGDEIDLDVHQLASWSPDEMSASEFAYGPIGGKKKPRQGIVVETKIPIDDVWSAGHLGGRDPLRFSDQKTEIVTLNKQPQRRARIVSSR